MILQVDEMSRAQMGWGEGNGTPLQYSCLENPMGGGAWWAAVHGVAKSRTWLSDFTFTFHFHALEKEMATHSSVLAWRIPGTGEPGGLPLHRIGHNWSDLAAAAAAGMACFLVVLMGLLVGLQSVAWSQLAKEGPTRMFKALTVLIGLTGLFEPSLSLSRQWLSRGHCRISLCRILLIKESHEARPDIKGREIKIMPPTLSFQLWSYWFTFYFHKFSIIFLSIAIYH